MSLATLTGVLLAMVVVAVFIAGPMPVAVLALAAIGLAAAEAYAGLRQVGAHPATILGIVAVLTLGVAVYNKGAGAIGAVTVLTIVFGFLWYLFSEQRVDVLDGIGATVFVYTWVGVLGSYALLLVAPHTFAHRHGLAYLFGAILLTVSNDTGALFIGRALGKRPINASLSPNKTIAGLVGGSGRHADRRRRAAAADEPVDPPRGPRGRGRAVRRGAAGRPLRVDGQALARREGPRAGPARPRRAARPHRRPALRPAHDLLPAARPQAGLAVSPARRRVALLGATGSIGTQTLDVLRLEPDRLELVAVSGARRVDELAKTANEFAVARVGVATEDDRERVTALLDHPAEVVVGAAGLESLAADADVVVNAVVGFAGLPVTLAALRAGRRLALANKESLIAAAPLVAAARATPGASVLPVDSEHCALHQCLAGAAPGEGYPDVRRLVLTASGGPFRGWGAERLARATKADALTHPTWSMGPKITVDSSTLMNKGLEVLEASALFTVGVERIDVVVHPQSIVHSMVEFVDGSVLAQLSLPDMRLPIAYCLGLPERLPHGWGAMDLTRGLELTFEPPDRALFPALDLAYAAARRAGAAPAWLNAANEVAVQAFLDDRIAWAEIVPLVASVLDAYVDVEPADVVQLLGEDAAARAEATRLLA